MIDTLRVRRDVAASILDGIEGVKCFTPESTFYLWPNVTELMRTKGLTDYEDFRRAALHATGVSFCSRIHFGRPTPGEKNQYIRFAYSGIGTSEIEEGLTKFKAWSES